LASNLSGHAAVLKSLTFASMDFTSTFANSYMLTGNVVAAGIIAIKPVLHAVGHNVHERVCARVHAGNDVGALGRHFCGNRAA
jgi:uncharacterized membrane protein